MKNNTERLAKARTEQLIVKEIEGEVLIYDLKTDRAHCLNKTAAEVWRHCNGRNTVSQIAELVGNESQAQVDERVVWLALDQLAEFKLLTNTYSKPLPLDGMTRRQLARQIGIAAIALPLIVSMAAPPAALAASKLPPGSCCGNNGDCSSASCVPFTPCPSGKHCA